MFCTQCGTQLADSSRFCTACGKPVDAEPSATLPVQAAPRKRLKRIRNGKKIAGVCNGFADYFDTDVSLMRIVWIALLLLPPSIGLIAYVIAWIVLPVE